MTERIDPVPYDPERFLGHLREAAGLLEAGLDERKTRQCLKVFDDEFRTCVVQLKAASKPGSGVYYRFFYNGLRDLTRRAREAGLLPEGPSRLTSLQEETLAAFPRATRAGLDFAGRFGLAKEWTFTGGPVPLEEVAALPSVPGSVREALPLFRRHGLRDVFFLAADFQKGTMNVYFGWDPGCRSEEWIRRLVRETGGEEPSRELCRDILESQAASGGVGTTFAWDRPGLLRWCLYSLEVPYGEGMLSPVPLPALPRRLARFRTAAPTLNDSPQYNLAWSFGAAGPYVKLEKSYARDATWFLTHEMGGNLSRPAALGVGC